MCIEYETEALRQGQIDVSLSIDMLSWGQLQEARGWDVYGLKGAAGFY